MGILIAVILEVELLFNKRTYDEIKSTNKKQYRHKLNKELILEICISSILLYIAYSFYKLNLIGQFWLLLSIILLIYVTYRIIKAIKNYSSLSNDWNIMEKMMDYANKENIKAKYQFSDKGISYFEDKKLIIEKTWDELDSFVVTTDQIYIFYDKEDQTKWFWIPKGLTTQTTDFDYIINILNIRINKQTNSSQSDSIKL